jgi:hypothetical protein
MTETNQAGLTGVLWDSINGLLALAGMMLT